MEGSMHATVHPEDREIYGRICVAAAKVDKQLLPHAIARAVKLYLANVDRFDLQSLTEDEAAQEAVSRYMSMSATSPMKRATSPLKQSMRDADDYKGPKLSPKERDALRQSFVPPSVSPIKTKAFLEASDIKTSPGRGFKLPPSFKLKPSPEKGFWADMVKRDAALAQNEKVADLQKKSDFSLMSKSQLDEQMLHKHALQEAERKQKEALVQATVRQNKEGVRQARRDIVAKAEKHAKEMAAVEEFNAKEFALKKAAKQAELDNEKYFLDAAREKREKEEKAAQDRIAARKAMISDFMKQNETEVEAKKRAAIATKLEEARLTKAADDAAAEKERIRVADNKARLDAMKAKLEKMGDVFAAKADGDKIAAEKAAKEQQEREAEKDKAAAERARKHKELLLACGASMRDQMKEREAAERAAAEASRKELELLKLGAREENEKHKAVVAKRRAEAEKVARDTERILINRAKALVTPNETAVEIGMNGKLLDTSKGRGTCPW